MNEKNFNASINLNTIITALALGVLIWVGTTLNELQKDVAVMKQRILALETMRP